MCQCRILTANGIDIHRRKAPIGAGLPGPISDRIHRLVVTMYGGLLQRMNILHPVYSHLLSMSK